jgi:hypothetical protein
MAFGTPSRSEPRPSTKQRFWRSNPSANTTCASGPVARPSIEVKSPKRHAYCRGAKNGRVADWRREEARKEAIEKQRLKELLDA